MDRWPQSRTSTATTRFAWRWRTGRRRSTICRESKRCAISVSFRSCVWPADAIRTSCCGPWWNARGYPASASPSPHCTIFSSASRDRPPRRPTMRKILLMAKRDYLESIRTKAFILGLIVAPLLFGGGFLGIAVLKRQPDLNDKRIAIIDHTAAAAPFIIRAAQEKNEKELYAKGTRQQIAPRYVFETIAPAPGDANPQRLALSDRVRSRDLFAFVEIWPAALQPAPADVVTDKTPPRIAFYSNAGGIDE